MRAELAAEAGSEARTAEAGHRRGGRIPVVHLSGRLRCAGIVAGWQCTALGCPDGTALRLADCRRQRAPVGCKAGSAGWRPRAGGKRQASRPVAASMSATSRSRRPSSRRARLRLTTVRFGSAIGLRVGWPPIGVDANILLRRWLNDDPAPIRRIDVLLATHGGMPGSWLKTDVVVAEAGWTLMSGFEQDEHAQLIAARSLLGRAAFAFEDREAVAAAPNLFEAGSRRFVEGLILAMHDRRLRHHRNLRSRHAQADGGQGAPACAEGPRANARVVEADAMRARRSAQA